MRRQYLARRPSPLPVARPRREERWQDRRRTEPSQEDLNFIAALMELEEAESRVRPSPPPPPSEDMGFLDALKKSLFLPEDHPIDRAVRKAVEFGYERPTRFIEEEFAKPIVEGVIDLPYKFRDLALATARMDPDIITERMTPEERYEGMNLWAGVKPLLETFPFLIAPTSIGAKAGLESQAIRAATRARGSTTFGPGSKVGKVVPEGLARGGIETRLPAATSYQSLKAEALIRAAEALGPLAAVEAAPGAALGAARALPKPGQVGRALQAAAVAPISPTLPGTPSGMGATGMGAIRNIETLARSTVQQARTGEPFRAKLFRASGRETLEEAYDPHFAQTSILGTGRYTSPSSEFAQSFGPVLESVDVVLSNPLVISHDTQWQAIARKAKLFSDVPVNDAEIQSLRKAVIDDGYDGIVIRVPQDEQAGKKLQRAFSEDTVFEFNPPVAAAPVTPGPTVARATKMERSRTTGEMEEVPLTKAEIRTEAARASWLETTEGKRYTELVSAGEYRRIMRSSAENAEEERLFQQFLEQGMTPKERTAWRKESAQTAKADLKAEKKADAADALELDDLEEVPAPTPAAAAPRAAGAAVPEGVPAPAPARAVPEPMPSVGAVQARKIPSTVQRIEEPGVSPSLDKPQGLYTTPEEVVSPHLDLGGERYLYTVDPNANVLSIDVTDFITTNRGRYVGQSAGVGALKNLIGKDETTRFLALSKRDATAEMAQKYPDIDWERYFDTHEIAEAYAAKIAKERGYDAIWATDLNAPEFNEFVVLNNRIITPTTSGAVPEPMPGAPAAGVPEPVSAVEAAPIPAPVRTAAERAAVEGAAMPPGTAARRQEFEEFVGRSIVQADQPLARVPGQLAVPEPTVPTRVTPPRTFEEFIDRNIVHVESGAPDGPSLPPPGGRGPGGPSGPRGPFGPGREFELPDLPASPSLTAERVRLGMQPGERFDQAALRLYEGRVNADARRTSMIVDAGNKGLERDGLGIRSGTSRAARPEDIPDFDLLHRALHNPTLVTSGEINLPLRLYRHWEGLRKLMDWESGFRIDFDPSVATIDDYFYRGWKPPEGMFHEAGRSKGHLINTPSFMKERLRVSYEEMRRRGFEPLFWNPYEQWRVTRMQGVRYRQQMALVEILKKEGLDSIRPDTGGATPAGWRTPEVGTAFEGKNIGIIDPDTGKLRSIRTGRWIVRSEVANMLENAYGKKLNLDTFVVGGKEIDALKWIDRAVFIPKAARFFGSFFQHHDFYRRGGGYTMHSALNAMRMGKPYDSVKHLVQWPATVKDQVGAYFNPRWRNNLKQQLDSTAPLVEGRPRINMKNISEAGLSSFDSTIFPENMDIIAREIAEETDIIKVGKVVPRWFLKLESAMRRGLFDGVYPASVMNDVRKNIAPTMARMYGHLSDDQLNGMIAIAANKKWSTIPATQSIFQHRVGRYILTRGMLSLNENEALLRQAAGAIGSHNAGFWREHYAGMYLFLLVEAEIVHFIATGEHLPLNRFLPISDDEWGPLPFGYNSEFLTPDVPFIKGRSGQALLTDTVGQMDTILRTLDTWGFVEGRFSIPLRAFTNQWTAENFYGKPIDKVGPGGVFSRGVQLIRDLFEPLGAGQAGMEILRQTAPVPEGLISAAEPELGVLGHAFQAVGPNIRQELGTLQPIDRYLRRVTYSDVGNPAINEAYRKRTAARAQVLLDYPDPKDKFFRWLAYRDVNRYWSGVLNATRGDIDYPKGDPNDPVTQYYEILDSPVLVQDPRLYNEVTGQVTREGWNVVTILRTSLRDKLLMEDPSGAKLDYLYRNIHLDPGPPELIASLPAEAQANINRSLDAQRIYIRDLMSQGRKIPPLPEFPILTGTADTLGIPARQGGSPGGLLATPVRH